MTFLSFFITLISLFLLDLLWLGVMFKRFYEPNMAHLLSDSMQYFPAILFYLLYAFALNIFVVGPGLRDHSNYLHIFLFGLLFGLAAYGTYDLTNQATLKNWPWIQTIVDMAWGSFMSGAVAVASVYITRYYR